MFRSLFRMLKHIGLAVIAIIACVCMVEVGLRGHELYTRIHGEAATCCVLTPAPCPITFQQLAPLSQVTTVSHETGEPITIRTNSLGLRGPETTIPKPAETYRIVCLGDDATFAPDIAEDGTFSALIQSALTEQTGRSVEVINAGLPGYCPLLTLAWTKQRLVSLQPDLVVLCCDSSDVGDDRAVRPLARYAEDGVLQSVCHPAAGAGDPSMLQAIEEEFRLAAILGEQLGSYFDGEDQALGEPDDWDLPATVSETSDAIHIRQTWEPIAPIRDLCGQLSADFVVALVPSHDVASRSESGSLGEAARQLAEMTEQQGIPYLDVTAEFSPQTAAGLFSESSGALSTNGHAAFAELLCWAIVHRDKGESRPSASAVPITPAAAIVPQESPVRSERTSPLPLPTPGRRPRTGESPFTTNP